VDKETFDKIMSMTLKLTSDIDQTSAGFVDVVAMDMAGNLSMLQQKVDAIGRSLSATDPLFAGLLSFGMIQLVDKLNERIALQVQELT